MYMPHVHVTASVRSVRSESGVPSRENSGHRLQRWGPPGTFLVRSGQRSRGLFRSEVGGAPQKPVDALGALAALDFQFPAGYSGSPAGLSPFTAVGPPQGTGRQEQASHLEFLPVRSSTVIAFVPSGSSPLSRSSSPNNPFIAHSTLNTPLSVCLSVFFFSSPVETCGGRPK